MCMWSLEGWDQIKQGEMAEEHAEWRGLAQWMPGTRERGTRERGKEKEFQGLRRKKVGETPRFNSQVEDTGLSHVSN